MSTARKNRLDEIGRKLSQPDVYYYPTPNGGRFPYINAMGEHRELIISDPLEAAKLAKRHNLIHTYTTCTDGTVNMYRADTIEISSECAYWKSPKKVTWGQLEKEFTRYTALQFVAEFEMSIERMPVKLIDRSAGEKSINQAIVRSLFTDKQKRA